jgi:hypothetical protein
LCDPEKPRGIGVVKENVRKVLCPEGGTNGLEQMIKVSYGHPHYAERLPVSRAAVLSTRRLERFG